MPTTPLEPVTLARRAMATRFEIILYGENPLSLQAAGEEALDAVQHIESRLNLYAASSELSAINARAAHQPVRVEPELFALLQRAQAIHQASSGAFDITVAPLMKCWGFMEGSGARPDPADLEEARTHVGMHLVDLHPAARTIRFRREGVRIDLGAIGKGFAIDAAAEILREDGVTSALIHGGTSTTYALGHPPGQEAWKVAIEMPPEMAPLLESNAATPPDDAVAEFSRAILAVVSLKDTALSVSAVWGKAFQSETRWYGHVMDPRTGEPVRQALLAAVQHDSATDTDALSTSLLIGGREEQNRLRTQCPDVRSLVLGQKADDGVLWIDGNGIEASWPPIRHGSPPEQQPTQRR